MSPGAVPGDAAAPCPFCGYPNSLMHRPPLSYGGSYYRACLGCRAHGGWADTETQADENWNARSPASPSAEGERAAVLEEVRRRHAASKVEARTKPFAQDLLFHRGIEKALSDLDKWLSARPGTPAAPRSAGEERADGK